MTPSVPPAALRGNDWRSLDPPPPEDFHPTIPVTVVIPYYEAREALDLTLAALERQSYPRRLFEVVIVDDGSTIPLKAPESSPLTIRVFHQEDRGFGAARARNLGARVADHPILLLLDGDMLPEAGWLEAHARWHHTASDLVTIGFRAHTAVDGITAAAIRDRAGTLANLLERRAIDRPEWIEFYMVRTNELTSAADDLFRVVTSGNLGVTKWFFEQVGGFDESFDRWGMEDTEFGYRAHTRGGPLVPVREAFCWHQGGKASPDAGKRERLDFQRAKVSHLIAHADFRVDSPGRSFAVPRFVVTVDPLDRRPEVILTTVQEVLAGTVHDLVVWVGDRPGDPGFDWLRNGLEPDPRVHIGPVGSALERFPNSPFHINLPGGMVCGSAMIERLLQQLGPAAAATGRLAEGPPVSIVRAWALHRSARTGASIEDVGRVVALDPSGHGYHDDRRGSGPAAHRSWFRSKTARVLRELSRVRSPSQAWAFWRWIIMAVQLRLVGSLRRVALRGFPTGIRWFRSPPRPLRQAAYPLGVDIAVVGSRARAVFASSDRVHCSADVERVHLVLADGANMAPDPGHAAGPPVVILSDADPRLAVPAFDPEQMNPMNWARDAGIKTGALGPANLLPPDTTIDTVVQAADRAMLSKLHHLEDTAAFYPDIIRRSATLARLAATGVLIHINDHDPRLEAHLGSDLYGAMRDRRIPGADPGLRESISICMRRAALRAHSLRARARQAAREARLANLQGLPDVSIILPTRRPSLLRRSLQTAARQTYPHLELVLALHGEGFPDEIDTSVLPFQVEVVRVPSQAVFGSVLNLATEVVGGELLTKMDDDDLYSDEHVWDLVLAREFSGGNLVGKGAEFVHLVGSDRTIHRFVGGGESYSRTSTIAGGAMLIAVDDLVDAGGWRQVSTAVDRALATDLTRKGGRVYRTHGHGYMLVRHGNGHTWNAPDSYFLDQAESMRPGCDLAFAGIE